MEKFVEEVKEPSRKAQGTSGKRKDVNGKKPVQAKASPNGRVKKATPKTSSPKGKSAAKKKAATKAKPAKPSSTKGKKKK